jgi:hypothetical protein
MTELRTAEQRKADVMGVLQKDFDVWLATADPMGRPHLIAASGWWDGSRVVIATIGTSRTARNLAENSKAKVALGSQSDAILIDAALEDSVPAAEADEALTGGFAASAGWDPREVGPGWVFYRLRPTRIQAYRGYDELEGRDVMRGGRWLA